MSLTLVHASIDGDVRFPAIEPGAWREASRVERAADARNRYDLSFIELTRRGDGEAGRQGRPGIVRTSPMLAPNGVAEA